MALARAAAFVARGWSQASVRQAGHRAVGGLVDLVAPFAPGVLADFRAAGHRLVLSTTTPYDLVVPFAEALGFDEVVATRYEVVDGRYTGRLEGGFVWGLGKLQAVQAVGGGGRARPGRLPRLLGQRLRRPVALVGRAARTRSTPTRRSASWRWSAAGRSSTGTGRRACRR